MPNESSFTTLLGFNFIQKYYVYINTNLQDVSINRNVISLISKIRNSQEKNAEINSVLTRKVIFPLGQTVSGHINILQIPTCDEFLFNPKIISNSIDCLSQFIPMDTIHHWIKTILIHLTILSIIFFFIFIENKSNHEILHLNKGQKIRYSTTDCVEENLSSSISHQINLVRTNEILVIRKKK